MLDSSGSVPAAILSGNNVDMGFYDQCVDIAQNVNEEFVTGKYCYGGLIVPLTNSSVVNETDLLTVNTMKEVGFPYRDCALLSPITYIINYHRFNILRCLK